MGCRNGLVFVLVLAFFSLVPIALFDVADTQEVFVETPAPTPNTICNAKVDIKVSSKRVQIMAMFDYQRDRFGLWQYRALESLLAVYPKANLTLMLPIGLVCPGNPFVKTCEGLTDTWLQKYIKLGYDVDFVFVTPALLRSWGEWSPSGQIRRSWPGKQWFDQKFEIMKEALTNSKLVQSPELMRMAQLLALYRYGGIFFDFRTIFHGPFPETGHSFFHVSNCHSSPCSPPARGQQNAQPGAPSFTAYVPSAASQVVQCAMGRLDDCATSKSCDFNGMDALLAPCVLPNNNSSFIQSAEACKDQCKYVETSSVNSVSPNDSKSELWRLSGSVVTFAPTLPFLKIDVPLNDVWAQPRQCSVLGAMFRSILLASRAPAQHHSKGSLCPPAPNTSRGNASCGMTYMIPGAMKGGSTSLFACLSHHPQVVLPTVAGQGAKETHCFDLHTLNARHMDRGVANQCLSQLPFLEAGDNLITGDGTVTYSLDPKIPKEIAALYPRMKAIFVLRNPAKRSWSQFRFMESAISNKSLTFQEAVKHEAAAIGRHGNLKVGKIRYLEHFGNLTLSLHPSLRNMHVFGGFLTVGLYEYHLRIWEEAFHRSQMLVLSSEQFFKNSRATMRKVTDFLGLEPFSDIIDCMQLNVGRDTSLRKEVKKTDIETFVDDFYRPFNQRLYEYIGEDFGWDSS